MPRKPTDRKVTDIVVIERLPGETKRHCKTINSLDIQSCPKQSFQADHYEDDGSCKCPTMRSVWARKYADIWERIAEMAAGPGLSGSYAIIKMYQRTKPGQKTKQWVARVKVTPIHKKSPYVAPDDHALYGTQAKVIQADREREDKADVPHS